MGIHNKGQRLATPEWCEVSTSQRVRVSQSHMKWPLRLPCTFPPGPRYVLIPPCLDQKGKANESRNHKEFSVLYIKYHPEFLNIGNFRFSLDSLLAASTVSVSWMPIYGFWRLRTLGLLTTSRAGASLAFLRVGRSMPRRERETLMVGDTHTS